MTRLLYESWQRTICTDFSFFFVFLSSFLCWSMWNLTRVRLPLCRTTCTKLFWLSFVGSNARSPCSALRLLPGPSQLTETAYIRNSYYISNNKQCYCKFRTQQHYWYHMVYISILIIHAYTYSLLHNTLWLN